jgi:hypothetical protein
MAKAHRFRLDRDTGISIYLLGSGTPLRLEPGSYYTTENKDEVAALQGHVDVTEIKIPEKDKD